MIDYTLPLDDLPDPLPIVPLERPFEVTITPPGSKSITNRAYVLAALAKGESRVIRPLRSDDCDRLLEALCTLGAEARWEGEDVLITGVNGRFPRGGTVNLGDGGTPTRFMIACACLAAEPVVVDGSSRMRERPIAEGVDMLRQLGATIDYVEEEGRLPVRVTPSDDFKGGELTIGKTASSQFISALMLIGSVLAQGIRVVFDYEATSPGYINLTGAVMVQWGIRVSEFDITQPTSHNMSIRVEPRPLPSTRLHVQPDASSATYWWSAAALVVGSRVFVPGIHGGVAQPDMALPYWLQELGANARYVRDEPKMPDVSAEDVGIHVEGRKLAGNEQMIFKMASMPDATMSLAVVCATGLGQSHITGLHTLRVKETDRIAALANELTKVGCTVETTNDSITITPIPRDVTGNLARTEPVEIETYNDHRMAMAFAVLGLVRPNLSIRNPACVKKSYPGFWRDFAKLYQ
jgi:3-phosphoshikimate 1-carboxyvinyltransferase